MEIEARNYTKIRVLLYLRDRATEAGEGHTSDFSSMGGPAATFIEPYGEAWCWRAPATIAFDTGVNVASLYTILKRWRNNTWGHAEGRHFNALQMEDSRPHWLYRINAKGLSYLARLHRWYKPLEEVKASLVKYQEDMCCDYIPWHLAPRVISWHIKPSEWATHIHWPFAREADAGNAMWHMHGYEVANIDEAVHTARAIFGIMPSKECLAEAKRKEQFHIKRALNKLAADAGFATTTTE